MRGKEVSGGIDWNICRLVIPGALVHCDMEVVLNYHVADTFLMEILTERWYSVTIGAERELIRVVKDTTERPDGSIITVVSKRFRCLEERTVGST